jgi:hypothetical protein
MTWRQPGWKNLVALRGVLLVVSTALALSGCFLAPWSPDRPGPTAFLGPPVSVESCESCHAGNVSDVYAASTHAARGIRCGQCHRAGGHPDFTHPVADAACGGCHQAQYEQTLASKHFPARAQRSLDTDRAARVELRRAGFVVSTGGSGTFAGDVAAGELGGRLCAACHYDEHRLGRSAVRREDFCTGCHAGRDAHYATPEASGSNRCTTCHVRVGETVAGLIVNTHRFGMPGAGSSGP